MIPFKRLLAVAVLCAGAGLPLLSGGCHHGCQTCEEGCPPRPSPPAPMGTLSDPIWKRQERNAEASDFVVYEHEWRSNTALMNQLGETHVKQIAARSPKTPFPILIEPSSMKIDQETAYGYPVHPDPELDRKRRKVVVHALQQMGVADAEQRVVIAPALAPGYEEFEAERAYSRGFGGFNNLWGGFGGFGGFGGLGGFGGFGGGLGFF